MKPNSHERPDQLDALEEVSAPQLKSGAKLGFEHEPSLRRISFTVPYEVKGVIGIMAGAFCLLSLVMCFASGWALTPILFALSAAAAVWLCCGHYRIVIDAANRIAYRGARLPWVGEVRFRQEPLENFVRIEIHVSKHMVRPEINPALIKVLLVRKQGGGLKLYQNDDAPSSEPTSDPFAEALGRTLQRYTGLGVFRTQNRYMA